MDRFLFKKGFTLFELMIILIVIAIVATIIRHTTTQRPNSVSKLFYYTAFDNLRTGVAELVSDGFDNAGTIDKKLPDTGPAFCQALSSIINTVGNTNCANNTSGPFTSNNANFIATNGVRYYNFGANPTLELFTVYLDIDGPKGSSVLGEDVVQFTVNRDGTVLPQGPAATDLEYLSASVRYRDTDGNNVWVVQNTTYKSAACTAGIVIDAVYCAGIVPDPICNEANSCELLMIKPLPFKNR